MASAAAKPNVIYIMADELGYYEPGFMGEQNIQTPNLDRMAAAGIRFNNLFAGSSTPFPRPPVRPNGCFRSPPPKANS